MNPLIAIFHCTCISSIAKIFLSDFPGERPMQEFSGGQLKIAGVVVGNWGGSGRGRGDSPMQVFNSTVI